MANVALEIAHLQTVRFQDPLDKHGRGGYPHPLEGTHHLTRHFRRGLVAGADAELLLFLRQKQPVVHLTIDILFRPFLFFAQPMARVGHYKEVQIHLTVSIQELQTRNFLAVDGAVIPAGTAAAIHLGIGRKINHKADDGQSNNDRPEPRLMLADRPEHNFSSR